MEKKHNVPALRFPGFSGEWERKSLGDIVEIVMGQSPDGSNYFNKPCGKILVQGNADIKDGWVVPRIWTTQITKVAKAGDLIMSVRAPAGEMGRTAYDVVLGRGVAAIKGNDFIYHLLVNLNQKGYWKNFAAGSTFESLNADNIRQAIVGITSLMEQNEIGGFFENIDREISSVQRKIRKFQQFRQAMLTKLFPREGAAEPELRFRGFSGKWKRCKLGDVATFINGRAYTRDELLSTGKYKVLRVGNFYTNDKWYYSNLELGEKYYAHKGDLLYTWSATFGPHIWDGDTVIYHYHIWKVELSEYLDKLFALQLLELDRDALLSDTNGSTMIHITMSDMKNRWITISENIEEQKLIGLFFYHLNLFISLQQKKLERMQRLKAALLEKLFV